MEKPSIPVAGGLGAAAILAFVLNPWTNQSANVSNEAPATPNGATSGGPPANGTASATPYSLSENEQGPWYALCKVFATIDPEDAETKSDHPLREESGIQIHPPRAADAEQFSEEIKEETVTQTTSAGQIQHKFVPLYHYKSDLGSCLPAEITSSNKVPLQYLIATVPDPIGSHLALQFDRNVVAIERSAAANSFGFERSWFPWSEIAKAAGSKDASEAKFKQQLSDQPGILIFRRFNKLDSPGALKSKADASIYSPRLLVFLVGETPTSGLNKVAFTKAITYIAQLECRLGTRSQCQVAAGSTNSPDAAPLCATETTQVAILGPSYSASFSPLYRALHDLRKHRICISADVRSPTTTVEGLQQTFDAELNAEALGRFTALAPIDETTEDTMVHYLTSLGYDPREVVYLSEDETPYTPGLRSKGTGSNQIPTLIYPRDLSALRNTWQPVSINITPADISGEAIRTRVVPFSLHEQASNELDSPPSFATEQAAPDIDQELSNLITTMRHRRYRVAIVTASNPLDEVYLLQYVHVNAPDIRLATYDQDSLILRATDYDTLRGTISVTSFPLSSTLRFDQTDNFTADFPNSAAEATYIGANLFLTSQPPGNILINKALKKTDPVFLDHLKNKPGTYLLGSDSFWPAQEAAPVKPLSPEPPLVPWIWYIVTAGLLSLTLFHLWKYRKLYLPHKAPTKLRSFSGLSRRIGLQGSRRTEDLVQDYFLLVGNNQLFILLFLIVLPSVVLYPFFIKPIYQHSATVYVIKVSLLSIELLISAVIATASVLLCIRMLRTIDIVGAIGKPGGEEESAETALALAERATFRDVNTINRKDLITVIAYPVVTLFMLSYAILADWANVQLTAFRHIYLLDGLSPLPVAASVIIVWYLFAIMGLGAVRNMKVLRVDPPMAGPEGFRTCPAWSKSIERAQRFLLRDVESFSKVDLKRSAILLIGFVALVFVQAWQALRGVDNGWFRGWLFSLGLGLLAVTVVMQFSRVWWVWTRLRALLSVLAASPIAVGFDRLPDDIRSVKLWRSFARSESRALQDYTLKLLRRMTNRAQDEVKRTLDPYVEAAQCHVDKLLYEQPWDEDIHLGDHMLLNACFDAPFRVSVKGMEQWFLRRCEQGDALVIDYAALRYVGLIKYVNAQMRWLLGFILYGYVFLIIGFKTYPFQGQHAISSILTIVFTIIFVFAAVLFVQMDSNELLSALERTTPGKANYLEAAVRLLSVGGVPLIAVVASQFPVFERFLLSWVRPTLESLH
jgi:hypothetical protein